MTKKAVRATDKKLNKLSAKYQDELNASADPAFVMHALAVLARSVANLYAGTDNMVPADVQECFREVNRRATRVWDTAERKATLEAAIRSGRYADIDSDW